MSNLTMKLASNRYFSKLSLVALVVVALLIVPAIVSQAAHAPSRAVTGDVPAINIALNGGATSNVNIGLNGGAAANVTVSMGANGSPANINITLNSESPGSVN